MGTTDYREPRFTREGMKALKDEWSRANESIVTGSSPPADEQPQPDTPTTPDNDSTTGGSG